MIQLFHFHAAALAFLLIVNGASLAATFYVSPDGDDSGSGAIDSPWKTPGHGSRQLQPGDTLVILGGRYILGRHDEIISPPSGVSGSWITIRGEEGHRPVLCGRDNLLTAMDLSGVRFVRIENLEITHDSNARGDALRFRDGIDILGEPAAHVVLQDIYIHHIDEFGINAQDVDDLQVLDSRIEYCGFGAVGGPAGEHGGWTNAVIRGSSLSWSGHYYQGGDGSGRPYDRPDGFGIEPSQGPVLIEDTRAEHNYGDGLDSKAANTTVRSCIVANNACDGVKLWADGSRIENTVIFGRGDGNTGATPWAPIVIDQVEQAGAHFEIVNVTVDDYVGQNYLMYVQYGNTVPVEVVVRNTIFSGRGEGCPVYVHPASRLTADHNIFYMPRNDTILTRETVNYSCGNIATLGAGNRCADPGFVAVETGDLHLSDSSSAIDAGNNHALSPEIIRDVDGKPRFFDMPSVTDTGVGDPPVVDIGAYEVQIEPRITVNNSDGPITLTRADTLKLKVSLNNRGVTDEADWWLVMGAPSGFYFFTLDGWTADWVPAYQGQLGFLEQFEVYAFPVSGLMPGPYTFFFCVDTRRDSSITWESLVCDAVAVRIAE